MIFTTPPPLPVEEGAEGEIATYFTVISRFILGLSALVIS